MPGSLTVNSQTVHSDAQGEIDAPSPSRSLTGSLAAPLAWPRRRQLATLAYLAALVVLVIVSGVPTRRPLLVAIVLTGLGITTIGHGWPRLRQVLVDWVPFSAVLILYDQSRKVANNFGVHVHERDIVHAEEWLFGGTTPTVWLQHHLYSPTHVYWYDGLCTIVYTSHFLATPILAAVLWLRNRAEWLRFITRVIVLSVAGLITYIAFPEAPPWMAAEHGLIPPVERLSSRGWEFFGIGHVGTFVEGAQNSPDANPVAAMPSLHVAFATLVAIFIARRFHSRWRWLAVLYPVAMGFTLVYTGEHYVLDLVAGYTYAIGSYAAVSLWERHRRSRRRRPSGPPALEAIGTSDVSAGVGAGAEAPVSARRDGLDDEPRSATVG